jgi:hypothetical protein
LIRSCGDNGCCTAYLERIPNGGDIHSKENSAPSLGRNPL